MKTSIYISNQSISFVVGEDAGRRIKVDFAASEKLDAGIFANCAILDKERLSARIGEVFNIHNLKRNNVGLVIGTDNIVLRPTNVPAMSHRRLKSLLYNEFAPLAAENSNLVYDYAVLKNRLEEGGGRILAAAADRTIIEDYYAVFESAGIKLKSIDLAQTCATRFFNFLEPYRNSAFIFSIIEGAEINSVLISGGEYLFSNRDYLTQERGTPGAAVEISRALSSMKQYNYARGTGAELQSVYISGLQGEETNFYSDLVEALALPVGPPAETKSVTGLGFEAIESDYGRYIYCLGNLVD